MLEANRQLSHSLFAAKRMLITRLGVTACFIYVAVAAPSTLLSGWTVVLAELTGFTLLVLAAMGRLWCHLYICGKKNDVLISDGPYSVVRNPLYLCNLVAAVGFGLALGQPLLVLSLLIGFLLFYPSVVAREEQELLLLFRDRYADYMAKTPRWIPCIGSYREPQSVILNPTAFNKAILNACAIVCLFLVWELIEHLRAAGMLARVL